MDPWDSETLHSSDVLSARRMPPSPWTQGAIYPGGLWSKGAMDPGVHEPSDPETLSFIDVLSPRMMLLRDINFEGITSRQLKESLIR